MKVNNGYFNKLNKKHISIWDVIKKEGNKNEQ